MESMSQRIKEIRGEKTAAEVVELNLDSCKSNGEPEGLEEYESLVKLSMNCVGLNSLKNFPKLLKLTRLELSDNHIAGSLSNLKQCQSLAHLNLSNNKIATVDALEPLAELKKLVSLDLFHCSVTETEDYRARVYKMLPALKYLDGFDVDGVERADSDDDEDEEENGHGDAVSKNGKNGDAAADDVAADDAEDEEDDDFDSGEDSEEEEGESEDEDDEEVGLEYLTKDIADDEEDDGDYEGEELDDDEDEDINDSDDGDLDSSDARGVKRKREEEDEEEEEE